MNTEPETLKTVATRQAKANAEARLREERETASTFDLSDLRRQLIAAAKAGQGSLMTTGLPSFADLTARNAFEQRVRAMVRELEPSADVRYAGGHWQFRICWTEAAIRYHYPRPSMY
jgi:hypothetical protein